MKKIKKIKINSGRKLSQKTITRRQQTGKLRSDLDKWIGSYEGTIGPKDLQNLKRVITNGGKITTMAGRERIRKMMTEFDLAAGKTLSNSQIKKLNKNVAKSYKTWQKEYLKSSRGNVAFDEDIEKIFRTKKVVQASMEVDATAALRKKAMKSLLRKNNFKNIVIAKGIDVANNSIFDVLKGIRSDSEELYEENRELILEYNTARSNIMKQEGVTKMKDLSREAKKQFNQNTAVRNLIHEHRRIKLNRD